MKNKKRHLNKHRLSDLPNKINANEYNDFESNTSKDNMVILIQKFFVGYLSRNLHKDVTNRNKKAMEILDSEQTYFDNLNLIYHYFYIPLANFANEKEKILSHGDIDVIFNDVLKIRESSEKILLLLKERMSIWQSSGQMIGDVIIDIIEKSMLDPYIAYTKNYNKNREYRDTLSSQNKNFKRFLKLISYLPAIEGKTLEDLMINPIQRIPRYLLLLDDLVKLTYNSHLDYHPLIKAKNLVSDFIEYLNENNRNKDMMMKLSTSLIGYGQLPVNENRELFHEGLLKHLDKRSKKARYSYLFSDCIVFLRCSKKKFCIGKSYKDMTILAHINLNQNVSVSPIDNCKGGFVFAISVSGKENRFRVGSPNEMRYWVSQIKLVLKKYSQVEKTSVCNNMTASNRDDQSMKPLHCKKDELIPLKEIK